MREYWTNLKSSRKNGFLFCEFSGKHVHFCIHITSQYKYTFDFGETSLETEVIFNKLALNSKRGAKSTVLWAKTRVTQKRTDRKRENS